MVFTRIPSNILIILVAFAPTLPLTIALYLARMALTNGYSYKTIVYSSSSQ